MKRKEIFNSKVQQQQKQKQKEKKILLKQNRKK